MTIGTQTRTNPFPGLRPFEAEEDHLFFGREGQTDELLRRLRSRRFLAVVGTSGSGKSSLVRAGLLPALYSGFMAGVGSNWRVALLRPGNAPIANLAEALNHTDVFGSDGEDQRLQTIITETVLRRGALGLVEAVQQSRLPDDENLLVVVDQFEELFRFKQQSSSEDAGDEAAAFVKLLLEATQQTALPIYVVLTMRSDFLGECAQFRDLPETMNDSQYLIPRMTRDQQRQAIEAPVAVGGATITPRLVSRLLNDVGDNPDQLPILQHALMRTWDYWTAHHEGNEPIDVPDYETIGGMERALSQHGDELYDGLPDDQARQRATWLFQCLTEKGADGRGIRRPTRLRDAGAIADASDADIIAIVEAFRTRSGTFLTPPLPTPLQADSMLDISHESLMRVWQRLDGWVEAESQSAQIYRRLADTAVLYQQQRAGLLRDPELTIALTWRQEQQPNAAWAERYAPNFDQTMQFLDASVTARDEEAAEKEANRKRELKRLRLFLAGLGLLSLLAVGAAVFAFQKQQEADNEKTNADVNFQSVTAQNLLASNLELESLIAAIKTGQQVQQLEKGKMLKPDTRMRAIATLRQVVYGVQEHDRLEGHSSSVLSVSFSPDGKTLATGSDDNTVKLWDVQAGRELQTLKGHSSSVYSVSFSPDGKTLATGSVDNTVKLWDVQAGREVQTLKGHSSSVWSVSFSPDGKTLATGSADNTVKLWDVQAGRELQTLKGHSSSVWSVSFSPDGKTLATGSADNTVKLWDVQAGRELQTLKGHSSSVWSVSFSPDGKTLATGSADNTVKLWDVQAGRELQTLKGHSSSVLSVSFSPDGKTLATGSDDNTVKLWNLNLDDLMARGCSWLDAYLSSHPEELATLPVCQTTANLITASQAWVKTAEQQASLGNVDKAMTMLRTALKWNPKLGVQLDAKEQQFKALALLAQGNEFVGKRDIKAAMDSYTQAQTLDPRSIDSVSAQNWNSLCWFGSLQGNAKAVLSACETAVKLAPKNIEFRDSRGLARALSGNTQGAIEDFQAFIAGTENQERKQQRQRWIDALRAGKNPFTPTELKSLEGQ
ncbi:hypothetical protein [Stenomitos frigidus]|uniref:Orc1-like AAA ATPase domain-containing protein n=1 Tax=Stenomitos frigidus ULC18 TaxID=2107698 RepID=A0A2T1DVX8_9CYAN|nr:hypothetical protein [Stenomitos frigidus]PSB24622.1 hypothetical protein C7B82_26760 [Stenomitos frigidus ULC18]